MVGRSIPMAAAPTLASPAAAHVPQNGGKAAR